MPELKGQITLRKTLKLNGAPARPKPASAMPVTAIKPTAKVVPSGAKVAASGDWAAEHKRRMQADMDALTGSRKR
jgi:hypothetical protein